MKKSIISVISLCLALAFVFLTVQLPVRAASAPKTYISDVRIGYDSDSSQAGAERARKSLTDYGYTVIDSDLNSGTGEGWSFVGYKTTTDVNEAITDLRVMEMDGGYELNNYYNVFSHYKGAITERAKGLLTAAKEIRENFSHNSKAAKWALENLNYLVVSTAGNMPLGDYLISTDRVQDDFYNIALKCDPNILTYILAQFALGVADYGDTTWLERFSTINSAKNDLSDTKCYDVAKGFLPVVQSFADKCIEADAALNNKTLTLEESEKSNYLMYISMYETLNAYSYEGDSIGDIMTTTEIPINTLYPLIYAMTPGQIAMLGMCGIETFISNLTINGDQADKTMQETKEKISNEIEQIKGLDLWNNIDLNVLEDKEIAVTSAASRKMISKNKIDSLAKTDQTKVYVKQALKVAAITLSAALFITNVTWGIMAASFGVSFSFSVAAATFIASVTSGIGTAFVGAIFAIGTFAFVVAVIAIVAIIIYFIIDFFKGEEEIKLTDIPSDIYDSFEIPSADDPNTIITKYVGYKVVTNTSDTAADLNVWQGKKWLALYYTKDKDIGSPILAPAEDGQINDYFMVKYGDAIASNGFTYLAKFGEKSAFNLNTGAKSDSKNGIYFFYKNENSPASTVTGEYLSDLVVFEESTEELVIAQILTKDMTPLKINLNPSSCDKVAMIGYTTTPSKNKAIRDIRIAVSYNAAQVYLGNCSYTRAGTYQDTTLFYSKGEQSGDPILASFCYTNSLSEAVPAGYESISLFSGGPAANMAIGSSLGDENRTPFPTDFAKLYQIYLYFKTGVIYDATAPDYVSGIAFFSSTNKDDAKECLSLYGYKSLDYDMTDKDYNHTIMGYSTTKNSKRALKRVNSYYINDTAAYMPADIMNKGLGYAAASVYKANKNSSMVGAGSVVSWVSTTDVSIRKDYAYISISGNSTLYVTSATTEGTPFTADQIKITENKLDVVDNGYYAVSDAMDSTQSAADLKRGNSSNDYLYMYLPGKLSPNGKYISQIVISGSEYGQVYSRTGLLGLGADELVEFSTVDSYYSVDKTKPDKSRLIDEYNLSTGLIHTNNINYAIRDIRLVVFSEDSEKVLPNSITYNNIEYALCSDNPCGYKKVVEYEDQGDNCYKADVVFEGGVYIYATSNPAAGEPITEISMKNSNSFKSGYERAQFIYTVDGCASYDDIVDAQDNDDNVNVFIKRTPATANYIKSVIPESDLLSSSVIKYFATMGYSNYLDFDFNQTNGGHYIYIAYDMTNNASDAITGLLAYRFTSYGDRVETLTKNGIVYTLCREIDFNRGAGGHFIYIYYTKDPKAGAPITEISASKTQTESGWNTVMDIDNYYSDFNGGASSLKSPDSLYLHFKRSDGSISENINVASVFSYPRAIIILSVTVILMLGAGVTVIVVKKRKKMESIK